MLALRTRPLGAKLFSAGEGMSTPADCRTSRNPCSTDQALSLACRDRLSSSLKALMSFSGTRQSVVFRRTYSREFDRAKEFLSAGFVRMPKKPFPEFVPPMMAESAEKPLDDPEWIFETELDGYRAIAVIDAAGKPDVWSRNRLTY